MNNEGLKIMNNPIYLLNFFELMKKLMKSE